MRTIALCFCLLPLWSAAQTPHRKTSGEDVKRQAKGLADTTSRYLGEKREDFAARMRLRLDSLNQQISELRTKAQTGSEQATARTKAELNQLDQRRDEVGRKLKEVEQGGAAAWQKLKSGVEQAADELEKGIAKAKR